MYKALLGTPQPTLCARHGARVGGRGGAGGGVRREGGDGIGKVMGGGGERSTSTSLCDHLRYPVLIQEAEGG